MKMLKKLLKGFSKTLSYAIALYFIGPCLGAGFAMGILLATRW